MAWHYFRDGITEGPVELADLQRLRQEGVVEAATPVWTEGMSDWIPFQDSAASTSSAAGGLTTSSLRTCAECGKSFPEDEMLQYEHAWVCAACKPIFFQRIKEGVAPHPNLVFASMGKRFGAIFIDGLIILVVFAIFVVPVLAEIFSKALHPNSSGHLTPPVYAKWQHLYIYLVEYGFPAAYEIFFIGRYGATWGKMAMKIRVVTPEGGPISYGRATGRHFAKTLSAILLYIGFFMAFWDDEKRALHDRICKTRVISDEA